MCFLLTVTLMSYCIKKATAGTCLMEIAILSFLVLLPFMAVLTAMFFVAPYFPSSSGDEETRSAQPACERSRVLGVLEKVYPDSKQMKFLCTGLNFGDNLGVTLTECFHGGKPVPGKHFITSRSPYWSKDSTIHSISRFNSLSENQESITILEAAPNLPEPCAGNDAGNLGGEDNYFYVEQQYQSSTDHNVVGWSSSSREAYVPYQELPVAGKCIPNYPSALIFTRNGYFTGFLSGTCTAQDPFEEAVIPYSQFLDQIHNLYPNVEYKNTAPQRRSMGMERKDDIFVIDKVEESKPGPTLNPPILNTLILTTKTPVEINKVTQVQMNKTQVPMNKTQVPMNKPEEKNIELFDKTLTNQSAIERSSHPKFDNDSEPETKVRSPKGTPIQGNHDSDLLQK